MCGVLSATACPCLVVNPFGDRAGRNSDEPGKGRHFLTMQNPDKICAVIWSLIAIAMALVVIYHVIQGTHDLHDFTWLMLAQVLALLYSIRSKLK